MISANEIGSRLSRDAADASMVGSMRLVLATSALLTASIDPESVNGVTGFAWIVFCVYNIHSLVLYLLSQLDQPFLQSKLIHWLDIAWYALIVFSTGAGNSYFFLFFIFAILTSSFRWGFDEGAKITLVSAGLFVAIAMAAKTEAEFSRLLLRTVFVLALGYMIAYWGGSEVAQKRRLALLRSVSQLSNPRFGVDRTLASVLEKTRDFFGASSCILVMRDRDSSAWSLRTAMADHAARSSHAERISAEATAPLMAFPADQTVAHTCRTWSWLPLTGRTWVLDNAKAAWVDRTGELGESVADLLEARSFITAPLPLMRGEGRIYIVSSRRRLGKADALFLNDIAAQAFPVIETIELLDRLASEAALRERRKIAHDLHDTAIQPYIGLKHGICAVRNKAAAGNPLIEDLDKLTDMTTQAVADLRRYAGNFKNGSSLSEPAFIAALRRLTDQTREFYGIDIAVSVEENLGISDRLAAEVYQFVNEGISNIRKHTSARCGFVKIGCARGRLNIRIGNEYGGNQEAEFMPRSIAERAMALGGKVQVEQGPMRSTAVHIEIPV